MPVLHITTNVDLEGIDVDIINTEATSAIASIIGRPEHMSHGWGSGKSSIQPIESELHEEMSKLQRFSTKEGTSFQVKSPRFDPPSLAEYLQENPQPHRTPQLIVCSDYRATIKAIRILVMVVLNGSVPISFTGSKDPAIFAQLISMGGINSIVKKKLITSLAAIFYSHLSVPPARFFCHVIDTTAGHPRSKL